MYIGLILKSYTDISKGSKNFSPKDKALTQRIVDIFHSLSHIKHYLPIFSTFSIVFLFFKKKYLYICIDLKVNRIEMEVSNNGS